MKNNNLERMVLGDEAASYAAIDSGAKGIFGYPGTPSTEIFEKAESIVASMNDGRVAEWAANEKVAFELALGASYSGHRTAVTMKHVGLNVAMDAFVNSAMTGVRGGLVVMVADDPSMHSSQNEQDSRYLADFAHIPCLEPSTPQEVYDFTCQAFYLSENLKLPVLLRLVTRLAHSRGPITRQQTQSPTSVGIPTEEEKKNWILIPSNARKVYKELRAKSPEMIKWADKHNTVVTKSEKLTVVTAGMGKAYFDQLCREEASVTEFSRYDISAYPVNTNVMKDIIGSSRRIIVFEENYPYLEDQLINLSNNSKTTVSGRRDGTVPMEGELTPLLLRSALDLDLPEAKEKSTIPLPIRPPKLCDGCGHIDAFNALNQAFKNIGVDDPRVFGDIGCYTLGALPPFEAITSCVEMGASAGMALGAALSGMTPSVGVIGDSTFFHSALPTLVSLAKTKVNVTLIIMDNRITAMTGQQETISTDIIPDIAKAVGFKEEQIHNLIPLPKKHEENTKAMEKILSHNGPDLVIFKRECIQALRKGLYKKIDNK